MVEGDDLRTIQVFLMVEGDVLSTFDCRGRRFKDDFSIFDGKRETTYAFLMVHGSESSVFGGSERRHNIVHFAEASLLGDYHHAFVSASCYSYFHRLQQGGVHVRACTRSLQDNKPKAAG